MRKPGRGADSPKKRKGKKAEGVTRQEILGLMEKEDRPLLVREVFRLLGLEKEAKETAKGVIRELAEEGRLVRIRGNRYGLPEKMSLVVGSQCHPDGYGFVIPEEPGEEDIFFSPEASGGMHGDRVVVRVESVRKKGKGRKGHPGFGKRKLRKSWASSCGGRIIPYLVPEDERVLQEVYIPEGETKRPDPTRSLWRRLRAIRQKGQDPRAGSSISLDILMIRRWSLRSSFTNMTFPSGFHRLP